jgi:HEAT repeat protein
MFGTLRRLFTGGAEAEPQGIPGLIAALGNEDEAARRGAVEALGNRGPEAIPALSDALRHESALVRAGACSALALVGPRGKEALTPLLSRLTDSAAEVRRAAITTVGGMGPEANVELTRIHTMVKSDADAGVRAATAVALARLGVTGHNNQKTDCVATLNRVLFNDAEVDEVRDACILGMWDSWQEGRSQVKEAFAKGEAAMRARVVRVLGSNGPRPVCPSDILIKALDEEALRAEAARGLGEVVVDRFDRERAVPALERWIEADEDATREAVREALERIVASS